MKYRKKLIKLGIEVIGNGYTQVMKKNTAPWKVSKKELLEMNTSTLGYHLGLFLTKNNFELIPKAERHDCFHVFTNYSPSIENEIGLQYLRFGNGARNIFTIGAVVFGMVLLPEYYEHYIESFLIGKKAMNFQKLDFKEHLNTSLESLRMFHFNQVQFHNPIK